MYEYEYTASVEGGPFFVARHFAPDPSWSWATAPGNYSFVVNVREAGTSGAGVASAPANFLIQ